MGEIVYDKKSSVFPVPQEEHLYPLLFSLLVNGIKSAIRDSIFLMFADDLNIFRRINSFGDCLTLKDE